MKFFHTVAYALMTSRAALAAPVVDSTTALALALDVAENQSVNPETAALIALDSRELEKRINCQNIKRVIRAIGTSKNVAVFITLAHVLTESICHLAHGENCADVAKVVQIGLTIVYTAAAYTSGAQPVDISNAKRGDIHAAYAGWWTDSLAANSNPLAFESIEAHPFDHEEAALHRRDGDPALVSRVHLKGASLHDDPTVKQDVVIHHFEDGNALLHLPTGNSTLDKRGLNGAGFKISYTTRQKSKLSPSHQQEMAAFTAASWAVTSAEKKNTDFIGFAETDHSANFYYRIIPESRAFGLNYESVDICGGMGGYL